MLYIVTYEARGALPGGFAVAIRQHTREGPAFGGGGGGGGAWALFFWGVVRR